jgi:hypothetical protein
MVRLAHADPCRVSCPPAPCGKTICRPAGRVRAASVPAGRRTDRFVAFRWPTHLRGSANGFASRMVRLAHADSVQSVLAARAMRQDDLSASRPCSCTVSSGRQADGSSCRVQMAGPRSGKWRSFFSSIRFAFFATSFQAGSGYTSRLPALIASMNSTITPRMRSEGSMNSTPDR